MNNNGDKSNKLTIDCPACKQRFSALMPEGEFINRLHVAMFIAALKPFKCLCGQTFIFGITGGAIQWGAQPVSEEVADKLGMSRILKLQ